MSDLPTSHCCPLPTLHLRPREGKGIAQVSPNGTCVSLLAPQLFSAHHHTLRWLLGHLNAASAWVCQEEALAEERGTRTGLHWHLPGGPEFHSTCGHSVVPEAQWPYLSMYSWFLVGLMCSLPGQEARTLRSSKQGLGLTGKCRNEVGSCPSPSMGSSWPNPSTRPCTI